MLSCQGVARKIIKRGPKICEKIYKNETKFTGRNYNLTYKTKKQCLMNYILISLKNNWSE